MKRKLILSVFLCSLLTAPAMSQDNQEKIDPELAALEAELAEADSKSEHARNIVRGAIASYWDERMNKIYQKILKHFAKSPKTIAKIKEAQRAWITYRDLNYSSQEFCLETRGEFQTDAAYMLFISTEMSKRRCRDLEVLLETVLE